MPNISFFLIYLSLDLCSCSKMLIVDVGFYGGSQKLREIKKGGEGESEHQGEIVRKESQSVSVRHIGAAPFLVMTACSICSPLLLLLSLPHFLFPSLAISIYLLSCSVIDLSIDWPSDPSSICLPLTDF